MDRDMFGTPFRPADTSNNLLRKILEALNAGAIVPGLFPLHFSVDPGFIDDPDTELPSIIIDFSGDPGNIGKWVSLQYAITDPNDPPPDVSAGPFDSPWIPYQLMQITVIPFTVTVNLNDFPVSQSPQRVCIRGVVGDTAAEAEDGPFISIGCWIYPDGVPGFDPNAFPLDTFDTYANGVQLAGLDGGRQWTSVWADQEVFIGIRSSENYDEYADDLMLSGLNGGMGFSSVWSDKENTLGINGEDTFDDYSSGISLAGLNSGFGWSAAWADEELNAGLKALDTLDEYSTAQNIAGLTGGTGWSAAWADQNNNL
jgi:hypothetical protein